MDVAAMTVRYRIIDVIHRDILIKQRFRVNLHSHNPLGLLDGIGRCRSFITLGDQLLKLVELLNDLFVLVYLGRAVIRVKADFNGFYHIHQLGVFNHHTQLGRLVLVVLVDGFQEYGRRGFVGIAC